MSTRLARSRSKVVGSACISDLSRIASRDDRPSTRYDARVNGAPANPISGTVDSRLTIRMASRSGPTATSGSNGRSRSTSSRERIGRSITGPTPSTISTSMPIPASGVVISANRIAASTPRRRTGWSVTSAHRAASRVISTSVARARIARYSARDRPAWRMNQTGVASTDSRRQARRKRSFMPGRPPERRPGWP